jgi:hypothetical protein
MQKHYSKASYATGSSDEIAQLKKLLQLPTGS